MLFHFYPDSLIYPCIHRSRNNLHDPTIIKIPIIIAAVPIYRRPTGIPGTILFYHVISFGLHNGFMKLLLLPSVYRRGNQTLDKCSDLAKITQLASTKSKSVRLMNLRNANQNHNEVPSQVVRMAAIKKSTNNKCWRGCGEKETLLHCWWECKLVHPLWRTVWRFLKNLKIELPYDPAILLLGIHTEETRIERDMCTPMFILALFIIARTGKQPRCPSADKRIRKLWYIYTMEYYSAIKKKNAFESVLMRWM